MKSKASLTTAIAAAPAAGMKLSDLGLAQIKPTAPHPPKPKTTRRPGILDRIQSCESREAASLMWHEFLDSANAVSQKTINKAERLLSTLDFPQA